MFTMHVIVTFHITQGEQPELFILTFVTYIVNPDLINLMEEGCIKNDWVSSPWMFWIILINSIGCQIGFYISIYVLPLYVV